jgi:hypothetical protein
LIGLAIAEGTGCEIADVFIRIIERLATMYSVDLTIKKSPRLYQTLERTTHSSSTAARKV